MGGGLTLADGSTSKGRSTKLYHLCDSANWPQEGTAWVLESTWTPLSLDGTMPVSLNWIMQCQGSAILDLYSTRNDQLQGPAWWEDRAGYVSFMNLRTLEIMRPKV